MKYLIVLFIFINNLYCGVKTDDCVVFVCNKAYFPKFINTVTLLTTVGNYHGDICLVIGDDLLGSQLLNTEEIKSNNVIIKHFPDLTFTPNFMEYFFSLERFPHWRKKIFQYHKFYLFDVFFKQWDTIFYIDCGTTIFSDIQPMLDVKEKNTLLAHSDGYPNFERKLIKQFDHTKVEYFKEVNNKYDLNIDFFQTTIMLYDTSIIQNDTFANLVNLAISYPISKTNDQGIIALYFTNIMPLWKQIPYGNSTTLFYDFTKRTNKNYIMIKYF